MSGDEQANGSDVLRVFQSKAERRAFYNKIAGVYDLLAEKSEQPMRSLGLELLALDQGEQVLEVGFGTGHCLVSMAQQVSAAGRVVGLDFSEKMLRMAVRTIAEAGVQAHVDLVCGDAERLPLQDATFDALFMSFTLELFDTPEIPHVLAECRRVLRPGGRMGVVALSKAGTRGLVVRAFEWTHRHFPNLIDCRPIYLEQTLAKAGFELVELERGHMWVPVEIAVAHS